MHWFDEPYFQLFCDLFFDFKDHANTSLNSVSKSWRYFLSSLFKVEPIIIKRGFSSLPKLRVTKVGSIGSLLFSNCLLILFSNSIEQLSVEFQYYETRQNKLNQNSSY